MNKKAYLILLAVAVQQSSLMAAWNWQKQNPQSSSSTAQTDAPTATTPVITITESLSENAEYRKKLAAKLREKLTQAKRGGVDVTDIEAIIITEHAPAIIKPGYDALEELEQKSAQDIAALRKENDDLINHITTTRRALLVSLVAASSYFIYTYTK